MLTKTTHGQRNQNPFSLSTYRFNQFNLQENCSFLSLSPFLQVKATEDSMKSFQILEVQSVDRTIQIVFL